MPFRLREDAKKWFADLLKDGFSVGFDAFYYCFIAGIAKGQKADVLTEEAPELVEYFPDRYRARSRLLVALFLTQELHALGVDMNDKLAVNSAISRLIDPNAPSHLSDEGMKEFNRYAYGGFEVLLDWFDDRPRTLETFLRQFKTELNNPLN